MPRLHVLFVDDDQGYIADFMEYCDGASVAGRDVVASSTDSFDNAESLISSERIDAIIVDLHEEGGDEHRGEGVLAKVKKTRFVPVVFYTGHAERLAHLENGEAFVAVVKKTDGFEAVFGKLEALLSRPVHVMQSAMRAVLDEAEASFLWGFVQRHSDILEADNRQHLLAGLLADRLSMFLKTEGLELLLTRLGGAATASVVHPITYYLIPPAGRAIRACDLVREPTSGIISLVLTPSCDLAEQVDGTRTAAQVLLVRALPLESAAIKYFDKWKQSSDAGSRTEREPDQRTKLKKFMANNTGPERYYFLPGFDSVPDLVLDFQSTYSEPYDEVSLYQRLAGLAAPHAQEIRNRFVRWVGRVGVPNLDTEYVIDRVRARLQELDGGGD